MSSLSQFSKIGLVFSNSTKGIIIGETKTIIIIDTQELKNICNARIVAAISSRAKMRIEKAKYNPTGPVKNEAKNSEATFAEDMLGPKLR